MRLTIDPGSVQLLIDLSVDRTVQILGEQLTTRADRSGPVRTRHEQAEQSALSILAGWQ